MVPRELTPASFETMTHFYEAWFFMKMVSNEAVLRQGSTFLPYGIGYHYPMGRHTFILHANFGIIHRLRTEKMRVTSCSLLW